MNKTRAAVSLITGIGIFSAFAADLNPGATLGSGQRLSSNNGKYSLVMQGDGNLVYYKNADGKVRWNSQTFGNPGATTTMQTDGNLVVYSQSTPKWNSQTSGNPGAVLAAQDDGNLVIYASGGQRALWNIGADPTEEDPKLMGDIVGRDLDLFGLGALGHVALFDGGAVYEALTEGGSAVKYNSLDNFKSRTKYWGVTSPKVPEYGVRMCADTSCSIFSDGGGWETFNSRYALVRRAYQIFLIGASYTYTAGYTPATARLYRDGGTTVVSAQQGVYRCDTFVVDVYDKITNIVGGSRSFDEIVWGVKNGAMTPANVFNKMKSAV